MIQLLVQRSIRISLKWLVCSYSAISSIERSHLCLKDRNFAASSEGEFDESESRGRLASIRRTLGDVDATNTTNGLLDGVTLTVVKQSSPVFEHGIKCKYLVIVCLSFKHHVNLVRIG